jgi:hypothetical protein
MHIERTGVFTPGPFYVHVCGEFFYGCETLTAVPETLTISMLPELTVS